MIKYLTNHFAAEQFCNLLSPSLGPLGVVKISANTVTMDEYGELNAVLIECANLTSVQSEAQNVFGIEKNGQKGGILTEKRQ